MDTGTAAVTRSTSTASPRRRSGAELAIDAIAGLLIAGLAVVPPVDVQEASLLVAALAFAAIIVRSVLPGTALVLAWAMALAQWQLGERPGFADVALLLVLYTRRRDADPARPPSSAPRPPSSAARWPPSTSCRRARASPS